MTGKKCIGLIFRTPEHGRVKNRLASQIGNEKTLLVYTLMLNATFQNISVLEDIDIYGFYDGGFPEDIYKKGWFKKIIPQKGEDLGEKLLEATKYLFNKGYNRIALMGADSPDLPVSHIKEALKKLDNFDLVIGPSEDGGYYLIAMKEPLNYIFKNIPWGSNEVLKSTIRIAQKKKISLYLLPEWYDIDTLKDLKRWLLSRGKDKISFKTNRME